MSYQICDDCGTWHSDMVGCPAKFDVYHPKYMGDEVVEVKARTVTGAAEIYAEDFNEDGEYLMMKGETIYLKVVDPAGQEWFLSVNAEPAIDYYTHKSSKEEFEAKNS